MPLSGPRTLRAIGWQSKIVARDSKAARNRTRGVTLPRACGSDRSGSSHIDRWRQTMAKSTVTYWNALKPENREMWKPVDGLEGMAEELTLSIDESTGGIHKAHTFPAWRRYHGVRRQDPPLSRGSVRRRRPYSRRGLRPLAGSWPLRNPPTRGASRASQDRCRLRHLGSVIPQSRTLFGSFGGVSFDMIEGGLRRRCFDRSQPASCCRSRPAASRRAEPHRCDSGRAGDRAYGHFDVPARAPLPQRGARF